MKQLDDELQTAVENSRCVDSRLQPLLASTVFSRFRSNPWTGAVFRGDFAAASLKQIRRVAITRVCRQVFRGDFAAASLKPPR
jgi:hypothetical protein